MQAFVTVIPLYMIDIFPNFLSMIKKLIKQIINKYILNPNDTFFRYDKTSFVTEIINGSDNLPVDKNL